MTGLAPTRTALSKFVMPPKLWSLEKCLTKMLHTQAVPLKSMDHTVTPSTAYTLSPAPAILKLLIVIKPCTVHRR